jgi:hypothetical protein
MTEITDYLKEQHRQINERHHSNIGTLWKFVPTQNTGVEYEQNGLLLR